MTLVARRLPRGRVEVWGHVRPASAPVAVEVSYRDPDGTRGLPQIAEADRGCCFRLICQGSPGTQMAGGLPPSGRPRAGGLGGAGAPHIPQIGYASGEN
jgi:hypothetical protein